MFTKVKISKIAVVLILTILIWVWTDLALDETYDVTGAEIVLTESNPRLWISFNGERTVDVNDILLKGPASRITNIKRKIENHSLSLLFPLDAEKEGLVESGEPLTVQTLIQKSAQFQDSGLVVESCVPEKIDINVVELIERPLAVECYDENGVPLSVESIIEPATVIVPVPPEGWPHESWTPGDKAKVVLTLGEIEKAKKEPVQKRAHIQLADGQMRLSSTSVAIQIPPEEDQLQSFDITPTIGITYSYPMQSLYKVEWLDQMAVVLGGSIKIRATIEAKARYEAQEKYKMSLFIYERDVDQEAVSRQVDYNFNQEDVKNGHIILDQSPLTVRFRLVPRSSPNP